ncbi:MAG: lytic transglycosylase domain-containing protein [Pseudonocardiales bacterium]
MNTEQHPKVPPPGLRTTLVAALRSGVSTMRRVVMPAPGSWKISCGVAALVAITVLIAALASDDGAPTRIQEEWAQPSGDLIPAPSLAADDPFGASGQIFDPNRLTTLAPPPGAATPIGGSVNHGRIFPHQLGIPGIVLDAYRVAATRLTITNPNCHLRWSLLAGIGRIESGHARNGRVDTAGTTLTPILGPPLSGGAGTALILDTDRGTLDGDTTYDRAVGPMQFIPTTWSAYGVDGNGDRQISPHNVYDAATAAGRYLCSGGLDLTDPAQRYSAVYRYNHSDSYVRTVLAWANAYDNGGTATSPLSTTSPAQALVPLLPPEQRTDNGPLATDVLPLTPAPPTVLAAPPPTTTEPSPPTISASPHTTTEPPPAITSESPPTTAEPPPPTTTEPPPPTTTEPPPTTTVPPPTTTEPPPTTTEPPPTTTEPPPTTTTAP